jgi:hypothetical protein
MVVDSTLEVNVIIPNSYISSINILWGAIAVKLITLYSCSIITKWNTRFLHGKVKCFVVGYVYSNSLKTTL